MWNTTGGISYAILYQPASAYAMAQANKASVDILHVVLIDVPHNQQWSITGIDMTFKPRNLACFLESQFNMSVVSMLINQ